MSRTQIRPKGGGDSYSPQRDLAYCYPPAMKEALRALDEENWTIEVRGLFERLHVTEEEVSLAVKSLTDAHMTFIVDPEVKHAEDALRNAGWYHQRPEVRYFIYGRLGEVMLGGFFLAIRDVRMLGEEPPHPREIADFIVEGLRVARSFAPKHMYDMAPSPEISAPAAPEESARVQLQFARQALVEKQVAHTLLQYAHHKAVSEGGLANDLINYIDSLGLWSGICRAIAVWWHGGTNPTPDEDKKS